MQTALLNKANDLLNSKDEALDAQGLKIITELLKKSLIWLNPWTKK